MMRPVVFSTFMHYTKGSSLPRTIPIDEGLVAAHSFLYMLHFDSTFREVVRRPPMHLSLLVWANFTVC